jgi:hypothetical protein
VKKFSKKFKKDFIIKKDSMTSFPSELYNYSVESLLQLLNNYYVRSHQGKIYSGDNTQNSILAFISSWLTPEPLEQENITDPMIAIRQLITFSVDSAINKDIIDRISEEKIPLASSALDDFAHYPMRVTFNNYDPWDLLRGYIQTEDKNKYFRQITGENPSNFLNHTERIFYLTRGYGRPNKYLSNTDNILRHFYMNAAPTGLIALSDLLGICPTRQNPDVIREKLSDIDLKSIDRYHQGAVEKITNCLGQELVCNVPQTSSLLTFPLRSGTNVDDFSITNEIVPQQCDQSKVACFEKFLNSIGISPIFEFDPFSNVFTSNISQMNLYRTVQPSKIWNFEEVRNLPDIVVASVIQSLPDNQLINISTPQGLRYVDTIDFSRPINRLRSRLTAGAINFLTQPQYYVNGNNIFCGRLVDDLKSMTVDDFIKSISKYGALIDPYYNVIDINSAEKLNKTLQNEILRQVILKTRALTIRNADLVDALSQEQKDDLIKPFKGFSEHGVNIDDLNMLLTGSARELILWSNKNEWSSVAIKFNDYFLLWSPTLSDVIKDTLDYYISIF